MAVTAKKRLVYKSFYWDGHNIDGVMAFFKEFTDNPEDIKTYKILYNPVTLELFTVWGACPADHYIVANEEEGVVFVDLSSYLRIYEELDTPQKGQKQA